MAKLARIIRADEFPHCCGGALVLPRETVANVWRVVNMKKEDAMTLDAVVAIVLFVLVIFVGNGSGPAGPPILPRG